MREISFIRIESYYLRQTERWFGVGQKGCRLNWLIINQTESIESVPLCYYVTEDCSYLVIDKHNLLVKNSIPNLANVYGDQYQRGYEILVLNCLEICEQVF